MLVVRTLLGGRTLRPRGLAPILAAAALLMPLASVPPVGAASPTASFRVNTTADRHAADPASGVCETAPGNGHCSLRAALEVTNNLAAGTAVTIAVPEGHYRLSLGELDLAPVATPASVAILGSGVRTTVLDGNHQSSVLVVTAPVGALGQGWPATIDGVTIQNGKGTASPQVGVVAGGLVNNFGVVTLSNARVSDNTVRGSSLINGGGVANHGSMTITNTTITENSVTGISGTGSTGGGLASGGVLTLGRATISENSVSGGVGVSGAVGGGVGNLGPITLTNATLSGNSVRQISSATGAILVEAGGLANIASFPTPPPFPSVVLTNVTVSANLVRGAGATAMAGGLAQARFTSDQLVPTNLANSIVASNTGGDCAGGLVDQGYNLDGDGSCGLSTANHDLPDTNPRLGRLQLNEPGNLETMALLRRSPAIDAGGTQANGCPATDERGVSRPQGAACDMGAYEKRAGRHEGDDDDD
jgi:hypothetical protein